LISWIHDHIIFGGLEVVAQIFVKVDKELKVEFERLSRIEGKTVNQRVRELMEEYVKDHDLEAAMKDLWRRDATGIKEEGFQSVRCPEKGTRGPQRTVRIVVEPYRSTK
jgi:hypothetical protein